MDEHVAFGTVLAFGDGGNVEVFTKIGQVKDISGPNMSRDTIDVTNHDSPNGYKEFLASLRDGGEVTFTVEYDPGDPNHDQSTGLLYLFGLNVRTNFQLIFPVTASVGFWGYTFTGLVTAFGAKAPVDGSLTADMTIKVAGAVALADLPLPVAVPPSVLALSSSTPTDNASGISKSASLVAVFNNALAIGAENGIVLSDAAGTLVATVKSLSVDRKTVTMTHSALSGTTVHLLSYGVTDVYGQIVTGVVSFTTTS